MQKGDLCYVPQRGAKYYEMEGKKAIKEKLTVSTPLGDVDSTVSNFITYLVVTYAKRMVNNHLLILT